MIDRVTPKNNRVEVIGGVAVIPIKGALMENVPLWFNWWGIEATSYIDIVEQVQSAVGNPETKTIRLMVDSPGGMVAGAELAVTAIFQARKHVKVEAHVLSMAASAAYELVSQAETITAGQDSMIGSIGTLWVFVDSSKMAEEEGIKVHVIKAGEHKGMGVDGAKITPKQIEGIQEVVDEMTKNFVARVAKGRGVSKSVVKTWATGQLWIAKQAVEIGLVDKIVKTNIVLNRSSKMAESTNVHTDATVEAGKEKVKQETTGLLTELRQAFPDNLDFAVAQFEKGHSVQEAKADYADVLKDELAEANKKVSQMEQESKKTETVDGAPPLQNNDGSPGSGTGENFHQMAKRLARENKTTYAAAAGQLSRDEPELYKAYQIACTKRSASVSR